MWTVIYQTGSQPAFPFFLIGKGGKVFHAVEMGAITTFYKIRSLYIHNHSESWQPFWTELEVISRS